MRWLRACLEVVCRQGVGRERVKDYLEGTARDSSAAKTATLAWVKFSLLSFFFFYIIIIIYRNRTSIPSLDEGTMEPRHGQAKS